MADDADKAEGASQDLKAAVEALTKRVEELTSLLRTNQGNWRSGYDPIALRFYRLAAVWKNDTLHLSNMTEKLSHWAYQEIIGLGTNVLPLIFAELERDPDDWFLALRKLTGVNPATSTQTLRETTDAWLEWARQHGYLRRGVTEEGLPEPELANIC